MTEVAGTLLDSPSIDFDYRAKLREYMYNSSEDEDHQLESTRKSEGNVSTEVAAENSTQQRFIPKLRGNIITRDELSCIIEECPSLRTNQPPYEGKHDGNMLEIEEGTGIERDVDLKSRGAELIGKIYSAQKEREESIKKRLQLVTEEKEELSMKVKKLEKDNGVDSGVETNSLGDELWLNADNMSIDEIVGRVINGKHSQSIEFNGELVVDRGSMSKGQKKRSHSSPSEMKKMKEERDCALKQVEQLTDELHEAQRERSMFETQHRKSEKSRLKIVQNQMKGIINDRDQAIEKARFMEEELDRLGLHRSHSSVKSGIGGEISLRQKFSDTLEEYQCKVKENEEEMLATQAAYDQLSNKMNRIVDEKNELARQLQASLASSSEDKKRADKLERLLVALRRRKER